MARHLGVTAAKQEVSSTNQQTGSLRHFQAVFLAPNVDMLNNTTMIVATKPGFLKAKYDLFIFLTSCFF